MTHALDAVLVAQARLATPLGALTAAATARGLAGLWFDGQKHHPGPLAAPVDAGHPFITQARRELEAFFADAAAGRRGDFAVPLDPQGTPFQRAVWQLLRALRCGERTHYGALAARLGRPLAARAVGAAVGRNPLSIIVPCHRVIGRDGSLTGYAGGLPRKEALLALEGEPRGGSADSNDSGGASAAPAPPRADTSFTRASRAAATSSSGAIGSLPAPAAAAARA